MKKSLPAGRQGFTIVEILIYIMILAMFFMAANVGYNSFIARKRTEMVARKVEAMFVKARGLSFSPGTVTGCSQPVDKYMVTVNSALATITVKCGATLSVLLETYTFENGITSSATGQVVGYKLLGHGLDVVDGFFNTASNYAITFNRTGAVTNGTVLTISQSGEVKITAQ